MSKKKQGSRKEWHIDHVKLPSSFDLTNKEEYLQAKHYTNMAPVWGHEGTEKKWEGVPTDEQKNTWIKVEVERLGKLVDIEREKQRNLKRNKVRSVEDLDNPEDHNIYE